MAGEASDRSHCINAKVGMRPTISRTTTGSDIVRHFEAARDLPDLYDMMENLSTCSPPKPAFSSKSFGHTYTSLGSRASVKDGELDEYEAIMANLKEMFHRNKKELNEKIWDELLDFDIVHKTDGTTLDDQKFSSVSFERCAVEDFIVRHAELLPRGLQTKVILVEKVLSHLALEMRGTKTDLDAKSEELNPSRSYLEIMKDLRSHIAEPGHFREKLKSLVMTETNVLKFIQEYVEFFQEPIGKYSEASIGVLWRAVGDLKIELWEQEITEEIEKERDEARKGFAEAYHKYHELVKSGMDSEQAMNVLSYEASQKQHSQELVHQDRLRKLEEQKSSCQAPLETHMALSTPSHSTLTEIDQTSDEEMDKNIQDSDDEVMDMCTGDFLTLVDEAGYIKDEVEKNNQKKNSKVWVSEDAFPCNNAFDDDDGMLDADDHLSSFDDRYDIYTKDWVVEGKKKQRDTAAGSPSKRRAPSCDRNPSPTKKGKISPRKANEFIPKDSDFCCSTKADASPAKTRDPPKNAKGGSLGEKGRRRSRRHLRTRRGDVDRGL